MEENLGKFSESIDLKEKDKSRNYNIVVDRIEADLACMKEIIEDLNRRRENIAELESQLVTQVSTSTWKEISELIGLSRATIIDECFKILDHPDDGEPLRPQK